MAFKLNNFQILRSGWVVLLSTIIGLYIGLYKEEYVDYVAPIGKMYLDALKMCILPMLLSAISVSIARLLQAKDNNQYLGRMLTVFTISIFLSSLLGVAVGVIGRPGADYDSATLSSLGSIVRDFRTADVETSFFEPFIPPEKESFVKTFFTNLIPENIFSALSSGNSLKVLFFSILFGLGIGCLNRVSSQNLIVTLDSIYLTFSKVIQWLMYFLPFGLLGLIAHDVSQVGMEILMAMVKFIPVALLGFLLLFIISSLIMRQRTGSLTLPLFALKDSIIMALGTGNALVCLPSVMAAMHQKLGYDKEAVDLLAPLSFTLCRTGPTLYFALATLFVAQLYNVELDLSGICVVFFSSIFAGLATAGASGLVLLSMLSLVLAPLGLPVDAVLVLFIIIDPIIGPFRVLAIVHTACAIITLVLPKNIQLNFYDDSINVRLPKQS